MCGEGCNQLSVIRDAVEPGQTVRKLRYQPLRAVWCNTRLLNSGGQFDQTCNLFGGAIPAQGLC